MSDRHWSSPEAEKPPKGIIVETIDSGGCVRDLIYDNGLWWFADKSMYVYFTPKFWRPKQ